MKELIIKRLKETQSVLEQFIAAPYTIDLIESAATLLAESLANGGKVISCGNGGSLCDATHFAEELTGRFRKNRKPLPAISINDPAYMTCVGNDFSFDDIYGRYVEALGKKEDVLLAISTSGNSENVIRAVDQAKKMGIKVIGLTRTGDNKLSKLSDIAICAPKTDYSDRTQEIHIKVIHIMIEVLELKLGF